MQKRKVDTRVTNDNKQSIINQINKHSVDNGYGKLSKKASIAEVTRMKNQYLENLTRDIVTVAIQQGKDIVAEIEARDLKKSDDMETKRLGDFAKDLAQAKREASKGLTANEKQILEKGNANIRGFGSSDIITLFEKTKTKGQAQDLINDIKNQNSKEILYNKQIDIFERSFQKIGITREEDIQKLKAKLKEMSMEDLISETNTLLKKIDIIDYKKFSQEADNETEIANARLDDELIRLGLKKDGKRKVQTTMKKYTKE
jgi:hypothetical protein